MCSMKSIMAQEFFNQFMAAYAPSKPCRFLLSMIPPAATLSVVFVERNVALTGQALKTRALSEFGSNVATHDRVKSDHGFIHSGCGKE